MPVAQHPSPADTGFFAKADAIGVLDFFKATATTPDNIAATAFRLIGRRVVMDQGYYGPLMRVSDKLIDQCFMAEIVRSQAPSMADYRAIRDKATAAELAAASRPSAIEPRAQAV